MPACPCAQGEGDSNGYTPNGTMIGYLYAAEWVAWVAATRVWARDMGYHPFLPIIMAVMSAKDREYFV